MDHALAIRRYLLDNDFKPTMEAIAKPDKAFDDDLAPLEAGLEHEEYVTSLIHRCYEVAHARARRPHDEVPRLVRGASRARRRPTPAT